MKRVRRVLLLAVFVGLLAPGAAAWAASSSDQLAAADTQLVGDYENDRSQAVDQLPLVMLVTPGMVTAYRYGRPTSYVVPAQASVDLKACAHGMLGFFGVFQPIAAGNTSEAQWTRVRRYRALIAPMPAMILHDRFVPARPAALAAGLLTRLLNATDGAWRAVPSPPVNWRAMSAASEPSWTRSTTGPARRMLARFSRRSNAFARLPVTPLERRVGGGR